MIEDIKINQTEAPEGASPPQDLVLDALPKETATDILKTVQRFGVREDDPLWVAILAILHARDLTLSVQDATTRIEDATKGVGEIIFNQTLHAGNDLKALLAAGIEEKTVEVGRAVVAIIQHSTQEGAKAIAKAAAGLPAAATAQRATILADWQSALATIATQKIAQQAQRGEWWVIGAAVTFGLVMALTGSWVGYRLAPKAWPAAAPPAAMWRFPKRDLNEYAWPATAARVARACPAGDVCVDLRRRR